MLAQRRRRWANIVPALFRVSYLRRQAVKADCRTVSCNAPVPFSSPPMINLSASGQTSP